MYGHCSICQFYGRLVTEHSHTTGLIRGYVCYGCNRKLVEIENGSHTHGSYHFVVDGTFVVEVPCERYHSYLQNPPMERFDARYEK